MESNDHHIDLWGDDKPKYKKVAYKQPGAFKTARYKQVLTAGEKVAKMAAEGLISEQQFMEYREQLT